ncbi:MAG TPA: serine/threonine-protein kinase [Candidatus Limnocylindrales bacterium]|nr:serine/threonine-protein kinase [Candidatus Limnocylindrales bacterium]
MEQSVLFGRYRLLSRVGAGGSAQVWRAEDARTGEEVAVKRLHPVVFADPAARRRLERESRALQGLDSPNIVRIRDSHVTDDEAALVLDFVPGVSLSERLTDHGRLSAAETVRVVRDIGAALSTAHAAGVVHRDVKPANIILSEEGRALLTDFGVARQHAGDVASGAATEVTAPGLVVGSLRYMSPEQLRGEPATPASDQYGLAAVAYEMLSGRAPYDASTPFALATAHAEAPAPLTGIEPALANAIERGLSADPAGRFPDVSSFAAAVQDAMQPAAANAQTTVIPAVGNAPAAPVTDAPASTGTTTPSHRAAIAAGALAVALAAFVTLAALDRGGPSSLPVERPAQAASTAPTSPPEASPAATAAPAAKDNDTGGGKGKGKDNGRGKDNGKGKND